eukprot:CAMPEP_0176074550 /NCGR_PEP_ID=MMETSP0120_2-20121206/37256_1 /TAXON_ID=160619 /ORGANISM="Kryptoperidinium foliaceum, Strain CCMP 1326" /LENGTH=70 /DNA_ID=CAMNT_0017408245 /DNA_START=56 /DNA_END=264 /DNA_ORIENTATION=-
MSGSSSFAPSILRTARMPEKGKSGKYGSTSAARQSSCSAAASALRPVSSNSAGAAPTSSSNGGCGPFCSA